MSQRQIVLRGVEVHNLRQIDLDLPHRQMIVVCGVSGSGKTSLAIDTLYAEGQRRYIESFSPYTRQFLEQLPKPAAERIDGIPAAVAVTPRQASRSNRATVATATEIAAYLQLLFARVGKIRCLRCGRPVHQETPQSVVEQLTELPAGLRFMIAFRAELPADEQVEESLAGLVREGFQRGICGGRIVNFSDVPGRMDRLEGPLLVVVDRLKTAAADVMRIRDSLETAFAHGSGRCFLLIDDADPAPGQLVQLEGKNWRQLGYSEDLTCADCELSYPGGDPRHFSFNSPLGACPHCEGFGTVAKMDMDLVVPDKKKSLRSGAIAPWNTPAYAHELEELLALADDYGIPVDVPFCHLGESHLKLIHEGVAEQEFGGLAGFFQYCFRD